MKSDKQICLIIASHPEWLFELSRLPSPGRCKMRSLVLKALQRTADALIVPDDPTQKLSLVEVQFYLDPDIYLRMVEEMAGAQREYERRDIQGILMVAKASYDPQNSPWRDVIKVVVLQDALRELEQSEPLHPLVAVFKPLFETLSRRSVIG